MSNNKQSMKLYTEEQLERAIDLAKRNVSKNRIVESLTPIELPSDEEIGKLRDEHIPVDEDDMWSERFYFTIGAKSLRDKIPGGNNEQQ